MLVLAVARDDHRLLPRVAGGGAAQPPERGRERPRPFEIAANRVAQPVPGRLQLDIARPDRREGREQDSSQEERGAAPQASTTRRRRRRTASSRDHSTTWAARSVPKDYRPVTTEIISKPPSEFDAAVVIAAGRSSGIQAERPRRLTGRQPRRQGHARSAASRRRSRCSRTRTSAVSRHGLPTTGADGDRPARARARGRRSSSTSVPKSEHVVERGRPARHGRLAAGVAQPPSSIRSGIPIGTVDERQPDRHRPLPADPGQAVRRLLAR